MMESWWPRRTRMSPGAGAWIWAGGQGHCDWAGGPRLLTHPARLPTQRHPPGAARGPSPELTPSVQVPTRFSKTPQPESPAEPSATNRGRTPVPSNPTPSALPTHLLRHRLLQPAPPLQLQREDGREAPRGRPAPPCPPGASRHTHHILLQAPRHLVLLKLSSFSLLLLCEGQTRPGEPRPRPHFSLPIPTPPPLSWAPNAWVVSRGKFRPPGAKGEGLMSLPAQACLCRSDQSEAP